MSCGLRCPRVKRSALLRILPPSSPHIRIFHSPFPIELLATDQLVYLAVLGLAVDGITGGDRSGVHESAALLTESINIVSDPILEAPLFSRTPVLSPEVPKGQGGAGLLQPAANTWESSADHENRGTGL